MTADTPDATAQDIAGRLRYAFGWLAHALVLRWPLSVENAGIGRIYWWLLPWAGLWAYRLDVRAILAAERDGGEVG